MTNCIISQCNKGEKYLNLYGEILSRRKIIL